MNYWQGVVATILTLYFRFNGMWFWHSCPLFGWLIVSPLLLPTPVL